MFSGFLSLTSSRHGTPFLQVTVWITCGSHTRHNTNNNVKERIGEALPFNFSCQVTGDHCDFRNTVATFLMVLSISSKQLKSPVYCSFETNSFFTTIQLQPVSLRTSTVFSSTLPCFWFQPTAPHTHCSAMETSFHRLKGADPLQFKI